MKRFTFLAMRAVVALSRRTRAQNIKLLLARGESISTLAIREVTPADVPALAELHFRAWRDTYRWILPRKLLNSPTVELRRRQWQQAFAEGGDWFCYVIQRQDGELVGFAKGIRCDDAEDAGELSKIFLLADYQRLGLGARLMELVARRFLQAGSSSLRAYVDARNPSCGFFENLGAQWLREPDGRINHEWYVWDDLPQLAERCVQAAERQSQLAPAHCGL